MYVEGSLDTFKIHINHTGENEWVMGVYDKGHGVERKRYGQSALWRARRVRTERKLVILEHLGAFHGKG